MNEYLKTKFYISQLLNLSVKTMNPISEDIIDLLEDKSDLSSSCKGVF